MLFKLAFRNVKRQIGNYVIYFITVSLTVALMFAVNNAIYEKQLLDRAAHIEELHRALLALTVFVALIVAFVLGYATAFMLRLRKREFGTYLTLGMTRRNILTVFVCETIFLCAVSLGTGLLLGLAFYQGLMAVVTNVMEMDFTFASYSLRGFVLTVAIVLAVFALASVTSAVYLKRVSIYNLLHGAQKQAKQVKHPAVWLALAAVALTAIILCCVGFLQTIKNMMTATANEAENGGFILFMCLLVLAVSVVLFHIGLCKSVVPLLLKSEKIKARGAGTFILRQMSGKLGSNAVMAGCLAFLLSFAVIGANLAFIMQIANKVQLDTDYPFDIAAQFSYDEEVAIPFEKAEEIIEKYTQIKAKIPYTVYRSQNNYLHTFTQRENSGYDADYDRFITESDYNALYGSLGHPALTLGNQFKIIPYLTRIKSYDFSAAALHLGDTTYPFGGFLAVEEHLPAYNFFLAVVPDAAAPYLEKTSYGAAYTVSPEKYDAGALCNELSYSHSTEWEGQQYSYIMCDYTVRERERLQMNARNAVYIVAALYVSLVFVFLSMAILALKTLSGIADDRRRYETLFRLGADAKQQSAALFKQTFFFFLLPFALPLLLSIPTAVVCRTIMKLASYTSAMAQTVTAACGIALLIAAVYMLYFTATYLLTRRTVLHRV